MLLERNIIEGAYLQDILEQPIALQKSLERFDEDPALVRIARNAESGAYKRIVLTGMGSSLHALYPLHLTLLNHGLPSVMVETSELIHYAAGLLNRESLVVAVSQSGRSAEILLLLEKVQGRAPVIGVTNNPDSPLAHLPEACLMFAAGIEATVSCKTYVATLLALEWLGAILCGAKLAETRRLLGLAPTAVSEYLSGWRQHVETLCERLAGVRQIFVTGRGASLATALTGGLILKESTRAPAEGMSCAAFRHGPFEMVSPSVFVLVMAGDPPTRELNHRLAEDVDAAGGRSGLVDTGGELNALTIPQVPGVIRPIVEILPVQMVSLALAALMGREAGRFHLASKITSIE